MFMLYSVGGWLTKSTSFSSDRSQAKLMTEAEAFDLASLYLSRGRTVIPVRVEDMNRIASAANDKR